MPTDEELEAYVDAAAAVLRLTLSAESRREVIANMRILRAHAAEFVDLPLDDALEPAAVLHL
jgi:hypothetical protein